MSSLINKAQVRKLALDTASARRMADGTPRFTRVSREFFEQVENAARQAVTSAVHALPSAGRTL